MSDLKPITLYTHAAGPNPWKVAIFMTELGLPYTETWIDFPNMKKPPLTNVNPNGRVPAIEDPNTGIALFESGAILEYLADTYDKDGKFSYKSGKEKYEQLSWLHFQMSGQGPYFGQRVWFARYHADKIPSAIERYGKEIERVLGVVDNHLKSTGKAYLVGDKYTFADLAWIPWDAGLDWMMPDLDTAKTFPAFHKWHQGMMERPAVEKVMAYRAKKMAEEQH